MDTTQAGGETNNQQTTAMDTSQWRPTSPTHPPPPHAQRLDPHTARMLSRIFRANTEALQATRGVPQSPTSKYELWT